VALRAHSSSPRITITLPLHSDYTAVIGDFRFTTFIEDIKSIMRDHPQPPDALQREALEGLGIPHEA
jgi:hypothetical protein